MPYHIRAWQQVALEHEGFVVEPQFIYERGGFSSPNIVRDLIKGRALSCAYGGSAGL